MFARASARYKDEPPAAKKEFKNGAVGPFHFCRVRLLVLLSLLVPEYLPQYMRPSPGSSPTPKPHPPKVCLLESPTMLALLSLLGASALAPLLCTRTSATPITYLPELADEEQQLQPRGPPCSQEPPIRPRAQHQLALGVRWTRTRRLDLDLFPITFPLTSPLPSSRSSSSSSRRAYSGD